MRIVLDAMGSDDCPDPEVQAAIEAANIYQDEILLIGPKDLLTEKFKSFGGGESNVLIIDAEDTITMQDKGLQLALKAKRRASKTSMAVGMDLIKTNQADAFVTAGNTGGALATAYYRLGTIEGVERPAVSAFFPVRNGACVVLDIGANPDCKPEHLLQFAVFGSIYSKKMRGIQDPKIGLLSNGEEPGKGNELVKEAFPLLENSGLNFVGNIEGKELFGGQVDVAVTDGFTGNILLKSSEAVAKLLIDTLKDELIKNNRTKIGALLAKPAFNKLRKMLDPAEIGAAPLLGVNGLVLIGHGRSDARSLVSAINTARQAVTENLIYALQIAIKQQLENLNK